MCLIHRYLFEFFFYMHGTMSFLSNGTDVKQYKRFTWEKCFNLSFLYHYLTDARCFFAYSFVCVNHLIVHSSLFVFPLIYRLYYFLYIFVL